MTTESTDLLGDVAAEFTGASIDDKRLQARLVRLATALERDPSLSLPAALPRDADLEGGYRFFANRRVTLDGVIGPHTMATARRCAEARSVYVVSDTTECSFKGAARAKNIPRLNGDSHGFLAHVALAVSKDGTRRPMGVLGIDIITREPKPKRHKNVYHQKKDKNRESLKWGRLVSKVGTVLPSDVQAIHVMDSEADIYELLSELQATKRQFIIRAGQERRLIDGLLSETVRCADVLLNREVKLSKRTPLNPNHSRRNPAREGRSATLSISSVQVEICRPKTTSSALPSSISTNVVRVSELSPPEGEVPVEWILFTSEPVDTADAVGDVVDGYRARWLIEEFFKALKTGCAYEERELETMRSLTNFLGVAAVLAWRLLLLRSVERDAPQTPAIQVCDPDLLEALAAQLVHTKAPEAARLPKNPTVAHVVAAIAFLGGHIKNNGRPGWQVLWRGYQRALEWAAAYTAGNRSLTAINREASRGEGIGLP